MIKYAMLLIAIESLMDTIGNYTNLSQFSGVVANKVKELFGIDVSSKFVNEFIENLVDNTFSKAQMGVMYMNMTLATTMINPIEDRFTESLNGQIGKLGRFFRGIKNGSFLNIFKKGAKANIVRDLVVRKEKKLKDISEYNYQVLSSSSHLTSAYSSGSWVQMSKDSKQSVLLNRDSKRSMNDIIQKLMNMQKVGS